MARMVNVGELVASDSPAEAGATAASPKSSTLITPADVIMMFAGFKSRWVIPFSWAASRASAICFA